jgi:hypothetical protein
MSTAARVDEIDGDLRVFDPPGGAGVLALDTDCVRALCRLRRYADPRAEALVDEGAGVRSPA